MACLVCQMPERTRLEDQREECLGKWHNKGLMGMAIKCVEVCASNGHV